jgi:hypothetical protein
MNPETTVWLEGAELEKFLERIKGVLSPGDFALVQGMANTLRLLVSMLQAAKASIKRLREMVFGSKTESTSKVLDDEPEAEGKGKETGTEDPPETAEEPAPVKVKRKGHGRNGKDDYPGAKKTFISHESLHHGDRCPCCEKGKVYKELHPGIFILFRGQAPIVADLFEQEKLRCNACGEVFTAKLPDGVGEKKYDPTAGSMLALMKYGCGFPFFRFERLQGSVGIPLPASTIWEVLARIAPMIRPVFGELLRLAAQGQVLYIDDTRMKILGLLKEIAERKLLTVGADEDKDAEDEVKGAEC